MNCVSNASLRQSGRAGLALLLAALLGCSPGEGEANRLDRPVAAVYSAAAGSVFVLQGGAQAAGGSIARLGLDGGVEQHHWRQGFGPQAALAAQGDAVYVVDGSRLWRFDARSGAELEQIAIDNTQLHDVAVDAHGLVHVLDQRRGQVLRVVGTHITQLPLPNQTRPLAILNTANALWILLAERDRDGVILLRRSLEDEERVCRLSSVGAHSLLVGLDRNRIGLFDPDAQRLRRFDRDCRELLHWRIAAGPVRLAQLPDDRLVIPDPESGKVAMTPTPDRLLSDAPTSFSSR